jgi:hypothetical protein
MKKERIDKIYDLLERFEIMGYQVTGGLYSDEFELLENKPEFKNNSIYFTEYQVVSGIMDAGFLRIINNINDEPELVDIILEQLDLEHYRDSNNDIWVRAYINELKQNYYEQRTSKSNKMDEILERETNI